MMNDIELGWKAKDFVPPLGHHCVHLYTSPHFKHLVIESVIIASQAPPPGRVPVHFLVEPDIAEDAWVGCQIEEIDKASLLL